MYLRRERFSKGTYHKLNTKKIGLCKVLKQINENAYLVDLHKEFHINPIFNVENVYPYQASAEEIAEYVLEEWN